MTDHPPRPPLDDIIRDPPDRPPPASIEEIEQRLQAELDARLDLVPLPAEVAVWAAALRDVAQTRDFHEAAAMRAARTPPPPFDIDALCARVWNAVQDAGAPTAASDAAVDAIRAAVA